MEHGKVLNVTRVGWLCCSAVALIDSQNRFYLVVGTNPAQSKNRLKFWKRFEIYVLFVDTYPQCREEHQ